MRLTDAGIGDKLKITGLAGGAAKNRLLDFGFCPGTAVRVLNIAPMGKTALLSLRGYTIALRESAASLVLVERAPAAAPLAAGNERTARKSAAQPDAGSPSRKAKKASPGAAG